MTKSIKRVGDIEGVEAILAYNRSGATRTKGQILMLDVLGTATETTSIVVGDEASVYSNLTTPATAGLALFPMYVLLDESCEDNTLGLWLASGVAEISTRDDDVATTDVDRGDGIGILNAQVSAEASASGNRVLGIYLEDAAASGSAGDAALKQALWWGGRWGAGLNQA